MPSPTLEEQLGVTFRDKNLLKQALTHRSFLNENRTWPVGNNEKLEFLGDAVIELIITTFLVIAFPDKAEGELTELRGILVRTTTLAEVADKFHLYEYIYMSRGEQRDTNPQKRTRITACAFEALVGAIYIDQGHDSATTFLNTKLLGHAKEVLERGRDSKSALQERTQGLLRITPTYKILEESGPDHGKRFVAGVFFGDKLIAWGKGHSKKIAEEKAAEAAMNQRGWDRNLPL